MLVCLCGSTSFKDDFEHESRKLALEGHVVLKPDVWKHWEGALLSETELSILHLVSSQKILLSDYVLVINRNKYIGNSTIAEIEFAKKNNIPVKFMEEMTPY